MGDTRVDAVTEAAEEATYMTVLGVFLLAIGLALALAVRDRVADVDLTMLGWILAGVGLLSLVVGLVQTSLRNRTEHRVVEDRNVYENRDIDSGPSV